MCVIFVIIPSIAFNQAYRSHQNKVHDNRQQEEGVHGGADGEKDPQVVGGGEEEWGEGWAAEEKVGGESWGGGGEEAATYDNGRPRGGCGS